MATRRPAASAQAVIVHVECGTQALGGAVHNAAKGRVAGVHLRRRCRPSPRKASCTGSRNEFIQWIQDVRDQRGIVRGYMKYDNELRTGRNVKQIVHRAMQFAHSDPQGPVYLVGRPRGDGGGGRRPRDRRRPSGRRSRPPRCRPTSVANARRGARRARRPLVVTSYLGRNRGCGRRAGRGYAAGSASACSNRCRAT